MWWIGLVLLLCGAGFIVLARVHTVHLTEGEALLAGWPYWTAAGGCLGLGGWLARAGRR